MGFSHVLRLLYADAKHISFYANKPAIWRSMGFKDAVPDQFT